MNPAYDEAAEAYRTEVRAFLDEHLPPGWRGIGALDGAALDAFVVQWRQTLYEHRLLAPTWPVSVGGGGRTALEQVVLAEELARAGVPAGGHNDPFGIQLVGNTLLRWGTEAQQAHFLPRILSGEDVWCQGYSEPDAGSDLGNLAARAVLDGDEWVIDGQKIWTSAAHLANWIFVLARTDPSAPKHRGISFLLVPMDEAGVLVRPIRMMSGDAHFNEVFFAGARCPAGNVVGGVNQGWSVAMTLLGYERGEAAATLPIRLRAELDRLVELARARGRHDAPLVRQRLAWCYSKVEVMRYLGLRTLTGVVAGEEPGPDASIAKLYWSEYHQVVTELAVEILGAEALTPTGRAGSLLSVPTDDPGAPNTSLSWVHALLFARADTIYAGTSEIQRNILAELVLGLPR